MSEARITELKMRIVFLKQLKDEEMTNWKPTKTYLEDLDISISDCERSLAFLEKNPEGYVKVA